MNQLPSERCKHSIHIITMDGLTQQNFLFTQLGTCHECRHWWVSMWILYIGYGKTGPAPTSDKDPGETSITRFKNYQMTLPVH